MLSLSERFSPMSKPLFIIPLLVFSLSLPLAVGREESGDTKKSVPSRTDTGVDVDKDQAPDEEESNEVAESQEAPAGVSNESGTGGREFLKFAEPKAARKKKVKTNPYGSYWTSLYGGKFVTGDAGEQEDEGIQPSFSPYYAEPATPKAPEKSQEPQVPKELQLAPLTPPPLSEFEEADFARFASGSYVSEYADRFVKMRCRFASLAPKGMRLEGFPAPGYVNFLVTGTGSTMFNLTVAVPSGKAGRVFGLESQKEIILYGRAVKLGINELTLLVEEVEVVGS